MSWLPFDGQNNSYDVIIIGAGISGINFAYRLQERHPELTYIILEGRHEIGGTWSLFKYPGIRSDSDLYTFGFSWRPWKEGTSIARGELIKKYVEESAALFGIDKRIRFLHKVTSAHFSTAQRSWNLDVESNGERKPFRARFMLLCTGYYDYHTPLQTSIPGIDSFSGPVIHPQFWPTDLDYTNKNVVVVGSGATAVTLLPVMAKTASHVTMLQRSPGYVVSLQSQDLIERVLQRYFSWWPSMRSFVCRAKWILTSLVVTSLSASLPTQTKSYILQRTRRALPESVPIDPHFNPKYYPWQQRMCLCPDGDFFNGLKSGKASIVTDVIDTVTPTSIKLKSNAELHPDIIVTATGLKLQFAGGIKIHVDGEELDIPSKFIWKGLMIEDLPNAAFSFGYVDASWTLGADATAQLVCRLLDDMQRDGVVQVTPRRTDEEKLSMQKRGLLRLNSTYVSEAAAVVPNAGDRGQWIPRSHYLRDIWNAWYGDIRTSLDRVRDA